MYIGDRVTFQSGKTFDHININGSKTRMSYISIFHQPSKYNRIIVRKPLLVYY